MLCILQLDEDKLSVFKLIIVSYSLNDIFFNDQGKSRQIDHIAITEFGVFVIETKNYAGYIYGREDSTKWKQYLNNKCFLFDNPINQNYGHKKIVEDLLSSSVFIESIVVFINRCNLKVETKSKVLYDYQIVNYINNKKRFCLKIK